MLGVHLVPLAFFLPSAPPASLHCRRAPIAQLAASVPDASLSGISMERQLGELSIGAIESSFPDREAILQGATVQASKLPEQARVGLFYGQLTKGSAAGTRCFVKSYSSQQNNELAAARATASDGDAAAEARMRSRLEALVSTPEAPSKLAEGTSLAEAIAENEFAAHLRVQGANPKEDVEKLGVLRMLGRMKPGEYMPGEDAVLLSVFPWKGEGVRMALPTRLPPTLASWAQARAKGETPGAKLWDASVPQQALQQRGRFLRSALRGALTGLSTLHAAGLVHQGLSPNAVLISLEDDREGEKVKGTLCELGFCRDAASLALAYRAGPDGNELPQYESLEDPLGTGLLERACMKCVRPGDPSQRAAFGRADDMREFGMLMLEMMVLGNAPQQADGDAPPPMDALKLRSLCDGAFAATSDGMRTDGVDIDGLRDYLQAEGSLLQTGGVGGADVLDLNEGSGWQLLKAMLAAEWEDRPTAEEALASKFWSMKLFI